MTDMNRHIMAADELVRWYTPQTDTERVLFDRLKNAVENLAPEVENLENRLTNSETECEDLQGKVSTLEEKVSTLEEDLEKERDTVFELKEQLEKQEAINALVN
jgi:chromosome segregation ATPase